MKKIYNTHLLAFLIVFTLALAALATKMWFVASILALLAYLIRKRYLEVSERARHASYLALRKADDDRRKANVKDDEELPLLPEMIAANRSQRSANFYQMVGKHLDEWPDDRSLEMQEFRAGHFAYYLD